MEVSEHAKFYTTEKIKNILKRYLHFEHQTHFLVIAGSTPVPTNLPVGRPAGFCFSWRIKVIPPRLPRP